MNIRSLTLDLSFTEVRESFFNRFKCAVVLVFIFSGLCYACNKTCKNLPEMEAVSETKEVIFLFLFYSCTVDNKYIFITYRKEYLHSGSKFVLLRGQGHHSLAYSHHFG